jgi:integral membrane sensor domain MASE1
MFLPGLVFRSITTRGPWLAYTSLTVAYAVSGALALLLAVPPGFASPIFPPAGIAVAAMLIGGRITLPWTFLGSFLLNLWTAFSIGLDSSATRLAVAFVIAAASALQAAVGGSVLRGAVGYPAPLDNGRDLSWFLLLPPGFCLISPTLSLGGLTWLGQIKWSDLVTNWISWWTGDTLGVLLVLPLMLVIAGEPRTLWRSRALPVALPMLLFCALFVAIFARVGKWEQDEALVEFRLRSQEIVDKIRSGLAEQAIFLEQLERSFSRPVAVSRSDFRHLTQSLLRRFSTIQAVKWAPRIISAQRIAFEKAQQAEVPGFEIREVDPEGQRRRAAERAYYYPVSYVEPVRGNEHIVGFDLASEPGRKTAIEEAFATGSIATTPPIRLLQEQGEQAGILIIFPVNDGPNGAGVLSVAVRMGTFMTELVFPIASVIAVRLVDLGGQTPLYSGFPASAEGVLYENTFAFGGRLSRRDGADPTLPGAAPEMAELGRACRRGGQHRSSRRMASAPYRAYAPHRDDRRKTDPRARDDQPPLAIRSKGTSAGRGGAATGPKNGSNRSAYRRHCA